MTWLGIIHAHVRPTGQEIIVNSVSHWWFGLTVTEPDVTVTNRLGSLRWRHNGRVGVSDHQPHDFLLNCSFRRRSKKRSKLHVTGLCAGNSPVTGEFPAQKASDAECVSIFDDVIMVIRALLLNVSKIFDFEEVHVRFFESHSYFTGATAVELQQNLTGVLMLLKIMDWKKNALLTLTPDCSWCKQPGLALLTLEEF